MIDDDDMFDEGTPWDYVVDLGQSLEVLIVAHNDLARQFEILIKAHNELAVDHEKMVTALKRAELQIKELRRLHFNG